MPCEGVFNAHPAVYRSALVGIKRGEGVEPILIVELDRDAGRPEFEKLKSELLEMGQRYEHTVPISTVRTVLILL